MSNNGYNIYKENSLQEFNKIKIIEKLYEGLLIFLNQAKQAIIDKNIEKKVYWINKSIAIFEALAINIDFKQGQISYYLNGLYNHQIQSLFKANLNNDIQMIDNTINVVKTLLEVWKEKIN